jgi:hypothetical protein
MGLFHVHLPQLATSTQVRPVLLGEKEAIANGIIIGCFVNVTQVNHARLFFILDRRHRDNGLIRDGVAFGRLARLLFCAAAAAVAGVARKRIGASPNFFHSGFQQ